jgi:hypothetical protein
MTDRQVFRILPPYRPPPRSSARSSCLKLELPAWGGLETEKLKFWNMSDWQFFRISGFCPLLSLKFCKPENLNFWSLAGWLDFTGRQPGTVASRWSQSGWQFFRISDFHRITCQSSRQPGLLWQALGMC